MVIRAMTAFGPISSAGFGLLSYSNLYAAKLSGVLYRFPRK